MKNKLPKRLLVFLESKGAVDRYLRNLSSDNVGREIPWDILNIENAFQWGLTNQGHRYWELLNQEYNIILDNEKDNG